MKPIRDLSTSHFALRTPHSAFRAPHSPRICGNVSLVLTASADAPRYSVVVPVYNEGANIGRFFDRAIETLPADGEILVVYDFDGDDTLPAIAALPPERIPAGMRSVKNDLGRGVRFAIEAGMRAARAPVVVVMMADLSDDFPKVETMIRQVEEGAKVSCASRYM